MLNLHRSLTVQQHDHIPLKCEALAAVVFTMYIFWHMYITEPTTKLPFVPLGVLLLLIVTGSSHLSLTDVHLARQGVVQGHCLIPLLATTLLFHVSIVGEPTGSPTDYHQRVLPYMFSTVAALILSSAVSLASVGIPSLCPSRRTHASSKMEVNTSISMSVTAAAGIFLVVFVLGMSSARFYACHLSIYVILTSLLPKVFPESFTIGECAMLSMMVTVVWVDTMLLVLDGAMPSGVMELLGLSGYAMHRPKVQDRTLLFTLIECGLSGTFVLMALLVPTLMKSMHDVQENAKARMEKTEKMEKEKVEKSKMLGLRNKKIGKLGKTGKTGERRSTFKQQQQQQILQIRSASIVPFYSTFLIGIALILGGTYYAMGSTNPVLFLYQYIVSKVHHGLYLGYWGIVLSVGVLAIGAPISETNQEKQQQQQQQRRQPKNVFLRLPHIVHRKLFHVLALALFVPPLWFSDYEFLSLSVAIALALSIVAELVRIGRVWPCGNPLHQYIRTQIDERDHGMLVLTHLYLLAGCGLPLWLCTSQLLTSPASGVSRMALAAGVLSTGVGDAMGAAIGSTWGRTRLYGTNKSLEGSLAMLGSMVLCSGLLCGWEVVLVPSRVAALVLCTVVEACTTTIDNLVLPMVLLSGVVMSEL